jgi:heme/copper-type cytochrome/quinol oxidase subunit 4
MFVERGQVMFNDFISKCSSKKMKSNIKSKNNKKQITIFIIGMVISVIEIAIVLLYDDLFKKVTVFLIVWIICFISSLVVLYCFTRIVYDSVPKGSELATAKQRYDYINGILNDNIYTYKKTFVLDEESIITLLIDAGKEQIKNQEKIQTLLIQSIGIQFVFGAISAFQSPVSLLFYVFLAIVLVLSLLIYFIQLFAKPEQSLKKTRLIVEALKIIKVQRNFQQKYSQEENSKTIERKDREWNFP